MAELDDPNYDGLRTFDWLAKLVGLPIDQLNFLITQFTALGLAGLLRSKLSPTVVTPAVRHIFGLVIGLTLGYFCFGRHAIHLAGLPAVTYVVIRSWDPQSMQRVVLAVAMLYLSAIHFHRQAYDYGSSALDITGPLMVITQKVTSLAYSLHDGLARKEDELTPAQRYHAMQKMPTFIEYFSYVLHFQALMAGPIIFYRDYINYVNGYGHTLTGNEESKGNGYKIVRDPSPTQAVVKKVAASLACAFIFVTFIPYYPIRRLKEEEFLQSTNFLQKYWYLIISTMLVRFKYYHAWLFADAICNNSGLGFNGFDENGSARWDLLSNVDVWKFETALSLHDSIEAWNKGTNRWLRMIVYDRVTKYRTVLTYGLSAVWHGFYPGYYLTFASGAFFTFVARTVRRHIRPYFVSSKSKKVFYDILTLVTTRLVLAYITFSFILLEFAPSITLYLNMYLAPHVFGLSAVLVLPLVPRTRELGGGSKMKPERPSSSSSSRNGRSAVVNHRDHHHNHHHGHVHKGK
ncbi:lysophospholipid acyltransferase 1 [Trichogramma pretiosum]|uniref:lysophospholipid acyltransferase 1 n=1 Tax=Trichogramma pretiosum TaxID=7493 RepID=UPI0006C984BB|nr:lysophospholipid acyltransferase 1 [Trichogramma pretiosum]